jgi:hypothetical protein
VRVRCESVDDVIVSRVMKMLPGARPKSVDTGEPEVEMTEEQSFASVEQLNVVAPWLLVEGTALELADGTEVRPAFYFDGHTKRHPRSLPGRLLRVEDKSTMVEAILRVGGYLPGGQADEASFPDGGRGGAADGVGDVPAGEGDGAEPVGGVA